MDIPFERLLEVEPVQLWQRVKGCSLRTVSVYVDHIDIFGDRKNETPAFCAF
ncbi:hypothetical protein ACFOLF_11890 [Paenibacillus sepulcri]|uniref:Integrase n=1 Tax=Paenibacillus sepulcri TaxID=359917 RepID=A0ABS7C5Z6_9BACL|nr:hypothetical protein [Paenibacillus sepulcri]